MRAGITSEALLQPLILTLALDGASHAFFEARRQEHFPPARNIVPAHLTLFHRLAGDDEGAVRSELATVAAGTTPFALSVERLRFLGRGVAYAIHSPELHALRARCAAVFADRLTPQDQQGYRPHVTIQNKANPVEAKDLFEALSAGFVPFEAEAVGFLLWRYLAGPWERIAFLPFAAWTDR